VLLNRLLSISSTLLAEMGEGVEMGEKAEAEGGQSGEPSRKFVGSVRDLLGPLQSPIVPSSSSPIQEAILPYVAARPPLLSLPTESTTPRGTVKGSESEGGRTYSHETTASGHKLVPGLNGSPRIVSPRGIIKNIDTDSGGRSPMLRTTPRQPGKGVTVAVPENGLHATVDLRTQNIKTPMPSSPGPELLNASLSGLRRRRNSLWSLSCDVMDGESSEASGYTGVTAATTITDYTSHDASSPYDPTTSEGRAIKKYLQQPLPIRASVVRVQPISQATLH
jgi:hypothetical protein